MSAAQPPLLDRGKAIWVTQRPKPYTNCMFASLCPVLSFMGYKLPDDFVEQLREASEVPRDKPTSTADTRNALKKLIPDCPIEYGGLEKNVLMRRLADGLIVARVMLRVEKLPDGHVTKKHFKPDFHGGHAVALAGAQPLPHDDFILRWLDPMGRPSNTYDGMDVLLSEIQNALVPTPSGKIKVTFGRQNAALPEQADEVNRGRMGGIIEDPPVMPDRALDPAEVVVLTRGRPGEVAFVPKGTPFLNPVTKALVTHAVGDFEFPIVGRSTDGKFAGVLINTRRIDGTLAPTVVLAERELIGLPSTKLG